MKHQTTLDFYKEIVNSEFEKHVIIIPSWSPSIFCQVWNIAAMTLRFLKFTVVEHDNSMIGEASYIYAYNGSKEKYLYFTKEDTSNQQLVHMEKSLYEKK